MILSQRRLDVLRRRTLLSLALLSAGLAAQPGVLFAVDDETTIELAPPSNHLRILPTLKVQSTDGKPKVKAMLVSDGWRARDAINALAPLVDPKPEAAKSTEPGFNLRGPETDANSDSSVLRIITPPATEPAAASLNKPALARPNESSLHAMFGPGANSAPQSEPAARVASKLAPTGQNDTRSAGDLDWLPGRDTKPNKPTANPEQNEPAAGKQKPPALNVEGMSVEPPAEPDDVDESDLNSALIEPVLNEPVPTSEVAGRAPLAVRDLKIGRDGTLDPPSIVNAKPKGSASAAAKPISNGDLARQSISDEAAELTPLPPPTPELAVVPTSRDRVTSSGELALGVGLLANVNRISASAARLRSAVERTLNHYWSKPEDAAERTHWGMFHNIMVYDKDTQIIVNKKRYNAVAWMAGNNACRNQLLFEEDSRGINVTTGVGVQGHQGQMLAVFGLIDVPASYPLYVGRNKYSVADVIRREMADCQSGNELTFTLIGLSHYIDTDSTWVAADGQDWNFERLIQEELAQPIVGSACGGTHRLMGFAHALRRRRAEGKPITGQWERADRYIDDFVTYTWQLQNRDGSMSTAWFEKVDDNGNMDRKVQTTGHIVEFLLTALPDDQLQSPQMLRSIDFLVTTLYAERGHDWQVGPKGHALRALAMYERRVFGRADPWRPVAVARRSASSAAR